MAATQAGTEIDPSVEIKAPVKPEYAEILTPGALALVAVLHRTFDARRRELLARRAEIQARLDAGWTPDFLTETRAIREADWKSRACPGGPARSPGRDHRARRPQDDHQCT